MSNIYTLEVTGTTDFAHATLSDESAEGEAVPLAAKAPDEDLSLLREVVRAVNEDGANGNLLQTADLLDAIAEEGADLSIRGTTYAHERIKGLLALRQNA